MYRQTNNTENTRTVGQFGDLVTGRRHMATARGLFIYFFGSFGLKYKQSASLSSLDSVVTLDERASLLPQ